MAVNHRFHTLMSITALLSSLLGMQAFQPTSMFLSYRRLTELNAFNLNKVTSRGELLRTLMKGAAAIPSAALILGNSNPSLAAAVASPEELKKLQLGHSRVQYLLTNWEKLTETCNNKAMSNTESKQVVRTEGGGGGFCDKTPLIVQEYLGYKSTTDPLFKADKLMLKAVPLVDESVMDAADYVDLVERFREKADQTSLMAYTSRLAFVFANMKPSTCTNYSSYPSESLVGVKRIQMGVRKL
jgi:hypothetical protein